MPNINDINGVTVANLAKLDAVLKANISKVNGLSFAAATGLLADYPGAAAAYSTRQLLSTVTVAMRVRRETAGGAGDDDEADIAFDSGVISLDSAVSNASAGVTATTLGEFINVGTVGGTTYSNPDSLTVTASCFVDEWKDQTGNANHAAQSAAGVQPQIHDGTVNTDLNTENGQPALTWGVFNNAKYLDASTGTISQPFTVFMVAQGTFTQQFPYFYSGQNTTIAGHGQISGVDRLYAGVALVSSGYDDTQKLFTDLFNTTSSIMRQNGSQTGSGNVGTDDLVDLTIGRLYSPSNGLQGSMQELVIYDSNQSSPTNNIPGIETDINSDYLIYQPTDAPTSGLLATYTGAAAAYSVRQLSDKAVIAMRIRRDSDDEERNIGFDSNGDLDTTAISDFCDTANGYVVEWADQSTNGNHASQSTSGSQPQIYNGTAVITENSKPAVDFDGTNALNISVTGTVTNFTAFFVRGFATYPTTFQNGFHYKARGIGYNQAGGTGYRITHLINGTASVQRADSYPTTTGQALDYFLNQSELYRNSAAQTLQSGSTYGTNTTSVIGGWQESSQNITATIQELIIYESDESSNRTGITSNITTYFSIS